jgi:NDP-4-keto-2,6-dideoxyhexose 3-C-methyltransferase
MVREETRCRVCGDSLFVVLNFGDIYPSAFVKKQGEVEKAPLVLAQCAKCGLVQLNHTVNLDLIYKKQYWYSSALNKSMISSLENVAVETLKRQKVDTGDIIIDIGCNDGTLFQFFPDDCFKFGFDPAPNFKEQAEANCDLFINDYFHSNLLPIGSHKKAKIITSIAMFYDLPNPHEFIDNVVQALSEDGTWVIQFTDLLSMLRLNAFDNVCHEHLEYYKLIDLIKMFAIHGLDIYDLEYNNVNGGSLRVYVATKGSRDISPVVEAAFNAEREYFGLFKDPIVAFHKRLKVAEFALTSFLKGARENGKRTFVLGASTKGNTLLQVWGLTKDDLPFALEVNEDKFGLRTVGSDIQIISESAGLALKPDYLLLLPWHFSSNIKNKLGEFFANGGRLITPLPNFALHYEEDGYQWILEQKVSVF